ncbi:MAG: hypothetical protein K8R02_07370 [Anaerohalosphaeraceae bacterium]|nr:hypothetical protein [Anaerohalosphaeraceae bacterium]
MSDKKTVDSKLKAGNKVEVRVSESKMLINRLAGKSFRRQSIWVFLLVLLFNASGSYCADPNISTPVRVRIFNLRHLGTDEAKKFLAGAKIGDSVFSIPGTSALSVTGKPEALVFASTLLRMIDSVTVYSMDISDLPAGSAEVLPERLEAELGRGFSVGSLSSAPSRQLAKKVIIESLNGRQIVIAPAETLVKVLEQINKLKSQPVVVEASPSIIPSAVAADDVNAAGNPYIIESPNVPAVVSSAAVESAVVIGEDEMLGDLLDELAENEPVVVSAEPVIEPEIVIEGFVEPSGLVELEPVVVENYGTFEPEPEQESEPEQNLDEMIAAKVKAILEQMNLGQTAPAEQNSVREPSAEVVEEIAVAEVNEANEITLVSARVAMDIPNGEQTIDLDLPEKLEIVTLIELVGKYMNLDYLYDGNKIKGDVRIKIQGRLKIRELYDLLENVLKFKGLVMSRKGDLVIIAPAAEILEQDPSFGDDPLKPGDVIVTNVFKLEHISTDAAKNLLGGMKFATNVTPIPETGTLVITDYAFRMQRIEDLLELVDVPGPPKKFKLRVLKYTLAESLVPKVQALAEQLGTVDITVGSGAPKTPLEKKRAARRKRAAREDPDTQVMRPRAQGKNQTSVYIDFDKRTNRVMMIGMAGEIATVDGIIDSLDVPQQDLRAIQEYELQYIDTVTVVDSLKNFGIIESDSSGQSGTAKRSSGKARRGANPQGEAPSSADGGAGSSGLVTIDQPQVVELETTNSLLVNATPEQHIQIARVISYVDREPLDEAIPFRIYRLENQEPEELAGVINDLIEKTIKDEKGKVQKKVTREEDIAVVADKNTFSLIVYANKRNQEWIANLIKTLDKRRPQVLIDVSLVEIDRDDDFEYDLSIVANATNLATGNIAITGNQLIKTAVGSVIEGGFNLTDATGANTKSVQGFYNAGKMQMLMRLLDKRGYGRVLAQPKVLVNDNELGLIQTTQKTHVKKEDVTYPGDPPLQKITVTWEPYEAKIELKITPQISEGDLLRLEIEMIREDFVETLEGPPDYTTSNVNTVVTVPDGSTIILGGLTKLNQTKAGSKIPGLGDVPILGGLFRSVDNANDEKRLYIFVKANILRPDVEEGLEQLKDISRKNRATFEKYEDQFQKHESFPGVKPTPIEPLNVLDDIRGGEEENN